MKILDNVLVVLRGSLIAQALSFLALPILSRLFSPQDFGHYQLYQAVAVFLLIAASLRYEVAILSARDDDHAFALARLCLQINVVMALFTLIACALLLVFLPSIADKLGRALWLLPVTLSAGGMFQTLVYLLSRSHAFRESSRNRAIQALSNSSIALVLGLFRATGVGLILADIGAKLLAAALTYKKMILVDSRYAFWREQTVSSRRVLAEYREYPLYGLPGALLNGLGIVVTPLFILAAFGPNLFGQYAIVDRSIAMPLSVITQAVSQVFMASFSASIDVDPGAAMAILRKIAVAHVKIAAIPTIVLMAAGPYLFSLVFGEQWRTAGEFAQVLAPLYLILFFTGPINMTLILLGRQKLNSVWYVGRLLAVSAAWGITTKLDATPKIALVVYVIVNGGSYLVLMGLIYRNTLGYRPSKMSSEAS